MSNFSRLGLMAVLASSAPTEFFIGKIKEEVENFEKSEGLPTERGEALSSLHAACGLFIMHLDSKQVKGDYVEHIKKKERSFDALDSFEKLEEEFNKENEEDG